MDYHGSTSPFSRKNHQEVKQWSAKLQRNKRDCLPKEFVFELPNAVYPKFPKIKKMKELKAIWESWTVERQDAFTAKYGDIALLLPIEIDEQLLQTPHFVRATVFNFILSQASNFSRYVVYLFYQVFESFYSVLISHFMPNCYLYLNIVSSNVMLCYFVSCLLINFCNQLCLVINYIFVINHAS